MKDVTVNLDVPSFYVEPDSKWYNFKRKLTYKTILKKIKRITKEKPDFSVLEVGTGSGFFMRYLEEEFPAAQIYGIEYDPRLVEITKKKVKRAHIYQGNAEDFNLERKFDIIVSLQVIEHLYRPENMLSVVFNHLEKQGFFLFTTPNLSSLSEKIMGQKWHGYREDHVSLKTVSEWQNLAEKSGFIPLYIGSTFFSGIPILNKLPLGILNWGLLYFVGSLKWNIGESFIGLFSVKN